MVRSLDCGDKLLGFESWALLLVTSRCSEQLCILFASVLIFENGDNASFPPHRVTMRNNELIVLKHLEECLVHGKHDKSVCIDPQSYLKP